MKDDNWLNAAHFECPHCGEKLYRVDHSPFSDDYQLYCERCPRSVSVVKWTSEFLIIRELATKNGQVTRNNLMKLVEERLQPCDCGGTFRDDAPRRCYQCGEIVISNMPDVDIYPYLPEEEFTETQEIRFAEFEEKFHRHENIWKYPD